MVTKFLPRTFREAAHLLDKVHFPVDIHLPGIKEEETYDFRNDIVRFIDYVDAITWLDLFFDDHGDIPDHPIQLGITVWAVPSHVK